MQIPSQVFLRRLLLQEMRLNDNTVAFAKHFFHLLVAGDVAVVVNNRRLRSLLLPFFHLAEFQVF